MEKNDGTALFAGDASFTARAGLADSAGVSYESFNLPGRYIRHYNYLLYVQAVSTTTARADATFYTQRGTTAVRYPPEGSDPTVGALRTDRHCHTLAWQWPFPAPLKAVRRLCSLLRVIAGSGPLPARSCGLASYATHRVEVRRHRGGCRPASDSQRVRVGPDERRPHQRGPDHLDQGLVDVCLDNVLRATARHHSPRNRHPKAPPAWKTPRHTSDV